MKTLVSRRNTKIHKKAGFTLLEITIAVVIIGILASIIVPHYGVVVERSRSSEALCVLDAVRKFQLARVDVGEGLATSMANLSILIDTPNYFNDPAPNDDNPIVTIQRTNDATSSGCGQYTIGMSHDGTITCTGSSNSCCSKMGYPGSGAVPSLPAEMGNGTM